MNSADPLDAYTHGHDFLGDRHERNARRTWAVVALTAAMMLAEIVAGLAFGSMALFADGIHMATHAGALAIAGFAYWFARRHVDDRRFTFGTGKVGDLAGFASALILAVVAVGVGVESIARLAHPVAIAFDQAIAVAALGLVVNLLSAWLLGDDHAHAHGHGHTHVHEHARDDAHAHVRARGEAHAHAHVHGVHEHDAHEHDAHEHDTHDHRHGEHARDAHDHDAHDRRGSVALARSHHVDHNLRSAYVHVLADALTSVLAIAALLAARGWGWVWMDPLMGVVGAVVIARWAYALLRDTGAVLVDAAPHRDLGDAIRARLERGSDRIADLHVWRVGPGRCAAIVSLVARDPLDPSAYRARLADLAELAHVTVEVRHRDVR
ncbi:MAG TPA: CDF family Co(II)/Ni(II) efflux transporter DmeF [Dokdonella sp.]